MPSLVANSSPRKFGASSDSTAEVPGATPSTERERYGSPPGNNERYVEEATPTVVSVDKPAKKFLTPPRTSRLSLRRASAGNNTTARTDPKLASSIGSAVATALSASDHNVGQYADQQAAGEVDGIEGTDDSTEKGGGSGISERDKELRDAASVSSAGSCPKWSEALRSPSEGDLFSPSREMSKSSSLHGLGLTIASDRAKVLSRSGKRCASLLIDLSAYHDSFAQALLKSCQTVNSSKLSSCPVSEINAEASQCVTSFAKQLQGLAICIKGSVARPLQGSSSAMTDTIPNIYNRYALTRVKCYNARQAALKARTKYIKSLNDAEAAILDMKKAKAAEEAREKKETASPSQPETADDASEASQSQHTEPTTLSPENEKMQTNKTPRGTTKGVWQDAVVKFGGKSLSKSADKVIAALEEVQHFEASYRALVEEENESVSRSQTMEEMALEALQKLEEERLHFFLETIERALQAEKGALDNMLLSIRKCVDDLLSMEPKIDALPSLSAADQTKANGQDSSTLAEVTSMQLPERVAQLRDDQKRIISCQAQRAQSIKALSIFFDEIAGAAHTFGSSLQSRLSQEGYSSRSVPKNVEVVSVTMNKYEGSHAHKFWKSVIDSLENFVKSASHMSSSLHSDGHKQFGRFLQNAERDLKSAYEMEESRWKKLCEKAKSKVKAEQRYEQSSSDLAKAQMRLDAAHETTEDAPEPPNSTMTSGMNKALGNMFSILPDGGDGAMSKMLKPGQRLAIMKRNREEAESKALRDQKIFESKKAEKAECIENYVNAANMDREKFLSDEKEAWTACKTSFVTIITSFQQLQESRQDVVDPAAVSIKNRGGDVVSEDMKECTEQIEEKRKLRVTRTEQDSGNGTMRFQTKTQSPSEGFSLQLQLKESKNVHKLLALVSSDDKQSPLLDDSDLGEEEDNADKENEDEFPARLSPSLSSVNELTSLDETSADSLEPLRGRSRSVDTLKLMQSSPRVLSTNTKELMSLAETLKTRTDNTEAGSAPPPEHQKKDKKAEPEGLNTPKSNKIETELFLNHFWEEAKGEGDDSGPPTIIASFSCAYWPKEGEGYISPLLHGRLFVTSQTMYFVGWTEKKIVLDWIDAIAVTKESTMAGTVANALKVTYDSGEGESSYFFGSFAFRENAFQIITQMIEVAKSLNEITDKKKKKSKKLPQVPPDEVVKKMDPVLSKKVKNMTIPTFYNICWSEGNGTDAEPFYGPFLLKGGCHDIDVGDWDDGDGGPGGFINAWCGEKYDRKRTVEFKFKRTTHLYIGPPIAGVTQTHHCRVEGNDKCVLAITVETHGIPYADVFAVEVRLVARRVGARDLMVDVGIFVDFKKSSMLKSQIRQGTITESKPIYMNLFEAIEEACEANAEPPDESEAEEEEEEEEALVEEEPEVKSRFQLVVSRVQEIKSSFAEYIDEIRKWAMERPAFRQIQIAAGLLVALCFLLWVITPATTAPPGDPNYISREELDQFRQQMEDMNSEMRELRGVLEQMLSLMQESHHNSVPQGDFADSVIEEL